VKREVVVNGEHRQLRVHGGRLDYGPLAAEFECLQTQPGAYWVRVGARSFRVLRGAGGEVSVNGRTWRMEVFDPRNRRAAAGAGARLGRQEVRAPMPGKVVRVLVEPGAPVSAGQGLVVVEAMKMQNEMKSPTAGTVREVRVRAEATVAAGEVLVVIE
jgi:acetyl/propionyl-CoA carboxylase alpha subunit